MSFAVVLTTAREQRKDDADELRRIEVVRILVGHISQRYSILNSPEVI